MQQHNSFGIIRKYFEPQTISTAEFKVLPKADREELAHLAAEQLGFEPVVKDGKTVFVRA